MEPQNYIIPVLHVQMGIVNKIIKHLIAWCERDVETMNGEDLSVRTAMIESSNDYGDAQEEYDLFI